MEKIIGVVFFMTSEHLEDLPLPRGRGFSGPRAENKVAFSSVSSFFDSYQFELE